MKKYVLHPGFIPSNRDRDYHYIGVGQLLQLYGVSEKDCIIDYPEHPNFTYNPADFIHLAPRYDGDYSIPKQEKSHKGSK